MPHRTTKAPSDQLEHDPMQGDGASLVPAVVRAVAVLDLLAHQNEPVSLARLTTELGLPKSSVRSISNTLVACGYVRRDVDGAYRLGPRVVSLAEMFLSRTDVAREFNAIWSESRSSPDETVLLSILSGEDALYLAVRNSVRPLGLAFKVGLRFPASLSASGKAMLAHLPPDDLSRRLSDHFDNQPHTGRAPKTLKALQKELELTRQRGYSIDDQGIREGVYAFGAPVFDATGSVVAAVSVCINTASLGKDGGERHREVAISVARELSLRLGGRVPAPGARAKAITR